MSPHAINDKYLPENGLEPPQLVNGDHIGWTSPTTDGTTPSESSGMASEPIAIVGMGEIRI